MPSDRMNGFLFTGLAHGGHLTRTTVGLTLLFLATVMSSSGPCLSLNPAMAPNEGRNLQMASQFSQILARRDGNIQPSIFNNNNKQQHHQEQQITGTKQQPQQVPAVLAPPVNREAKGHPIEGTKQLIQSESPEKPAEAPIEKAPLPVAPQAPASVPVPVAPQQPNEDPSAKDDGLSGPEVDSKKAAENNKQPSLSRLFKFGLGLVLG